MIADLTGVVLAGGRSSRFGSNKALAPWNGTTLVEAAANSLLRSIPKAVVVTKDASDYDYLGGDAIRVVRDLYPEGHPLGGIYTGLLAVKTTHVFVLACDMPFLQPGLVEMLWYARSHFDAVIPVWRGVRQPLCGIYSRSCAEPIRAAIARGDLGVAAFFDTLPTRFCLEAEVESVDPQGLSFMDIDTRDDYARARGLQPC